MKALIPLLFLTLSLQGQQAAKVIGREGNRTYLQTFTRQTVMYTHVKFDEGDTIYFKDHHLLLHYTKLKNVVPVDEGYYCMIGSLIYFNQSLKGLQKDVRKKNWVATRKCGTL